MNATDEIHHKWESFKTSWAIMWRAFGKDAPMDAFRDDVWEQCQYIPTEAWDYIVQQVRDLDMPPRNWAKKLKALHFQWSESRIPYSAKKERSREVDGPIGRRIVQLCKQGMPAFDAAKRAVEESGQAAGCFRQ